MVAVTVETESVRSSVIDSSLRQGCTLASESLFFVDYVTYAVREHSISRGQYVERLPQEDDLPVRHCAVPEKALMNEAAGDSGLLVNRIFTERLIGRVDVDLHVYEFEVRVHFFVKESKKGVDVLW